MGRRSDSSSLCWKSAPWAGAGQATFEPPQQWRQEQHTITDTFLEKSFAQRAGLGEPDPHACSASLKSAPSLWSGCLQQRPRLFLDLQLLKKAPWRPGGSNHLGHLCQAAAFSPGLGKSPPSWLIALGQCTWDSLAGSQAVWVSLQGALWPEVEVSLLQGPVASEGVTRGHNDLV